jgi:hypothetical protein
MESLEQLAVYRRCTERIAANWSTFQTRRLDRLRERERFGHAAEPATERIIEDLLTVVLDWAIADINHQVRYADLLLTRLGVKHLIVEAKRPGALAWDKRAVERARDQALRYAAEQKVRCVAISDGVMFYAADVVNGGPRHRVFCSLEDPAPQAALWWLSVDGIYRDCPEPEGPPFGVLPGPPAAEADLYQATADELIHPKYKLPARCFAYVGDASDPHTWHLPYLNADGSPDVRRLPKAVQTIVSNYRGAHVNSVPESAISDVLVRLARTAASLGKLPDQTPVPAPAYVRLVAALEQLGRLDEVRHEVA